MKINLNDLAKQITEDEGNKVSTNIAQVKEVMRLVLLALKGMTVEEVADVLKRVK